eukprot:Em0003g1293a
MMHAGIELRMLFMLSSSETQVLCTCGPSSPLILNTNSSSMSLQWNASLQPDYVITAYTLHHRVPSLKSQSEMWAPPSTATVQFHTYNPSGILFSDQQSVVGSNSTRTFNDGQWHTGYVVLFEQASDTFYVTVDTVHAAAITAVIVPLLTMKSTLRDFPARRANMALQPLTAWSYPLLNAPDEFDAVSVQNGAPPTLLCLGTCQLTVMASSSTSVCIAMVLWQVSCPLL